MEGGAALEDAYDGNNGSIRLLCPGIWVCLNKTETLHLHLIKHSVNTIADCEEWLGGMVTVSLMSPGTSGLAHLALLSASFN